MFMLRYYLTGENNIIYIICYLATGHGFNSWENINILEQIIAKTKQIYSTSIFPFKGVRLE